MEKYDTGFDLLSKNLEKVLKTSADSQQARTKFQNSMILAKMKANYEQQIKTGDRQNKFAMDLTLAKEKAAMPFQAYDEWKGRNPGGAPGSNPNITMGVSGNPREVRGSELFNEDLKRVGTGEMTWPELEMKHPARVPAIKKLRAENAKSQFYGTQKPPAPVGKWNPLRALPDYAYLGDLDPKTASVVKQMSASEDLTKDLAELKSREEEARKKGIDVDKIYKLVGVL